MFELEDPSQATKKNEIVIPSKKIDGLIYNPQKEIMNFTSFTLYQELHKKYHDVEEMRIRKLGLGGNRQKLMAENDLFESYVAQGKRGKEVFLEIAEEMGYSDEQQHSLWAKFEAKHRNDFRKHLVKIAFGDEEANTKIEPNEPFTD